MSIDYYLNSSMTADAQVNQKPRDMTAYYTETATPAGRWFGAGLTGLGITSGEEVTRTGARRLYEDACDPSTGKALGRRMSQNRKAPVAAKTPTGRLAMGSRESVAGFDLTFSAPKSVSTLWALGDYATQSKIEQAHYQAMQETLEWVESNVAQSRAGHGGVAHVAVKGLVGSTFDHWESREGDPQLHSHAVISNRVQRESDGEWVTLDSYTLHRHVVAISETYNSLLFDRLNEHVGAVPESRVTGSQTAVDDALRAVVKEADTETPDARHRVELAGVPDSLIEEFSTRSAAIEARTDELVQDYINANGREPLKSQVLQLRQRATLETRAPKDSTDAAAEPLSLKKHNWRKQAIAAGHDPATILDTALNHPGTTIRAEMLTDDVQQQLANWSLADASQQRATFTRANVVASSERVLRLVRCDSAEQRRALVDSVVDRSLASAVELTPRRSTTPTIADSSVTLRGTSVFDHQRHAGVWATRETLNAEAYLLERYQDKTAARLTYVQAKEKIGEARTSSGRTLSSDQARASSEVLSSGRTIDAVIGPAGTGKTTTMRAMSDVWTKEHGAGAVVGLAPSAVAASVLSEELGIPTENTSKWLYEATEGAARRAQRVAQRSDRLAGLEERAGDRPSAGQKAQMQSLRTQLAQDYAEQAKYTMRKDQLIIIDEASMVSTAQMTNLAHQAENAGAKIVLVGDPAQLGAVDSGGFLGYLDRTQDPAQLDKVWRFENEWERAASLQLRKGDTAALDAYEANGRLHGGEADPDATEAAYAAWKADRDAGKESILIAPDNETVSELNARAHRELVEAGTVDIESTVKVRGETPAGTGDVLLARRNDRSIRDSTGAFVANGTRMQISEIHRDGSAVGVSESTGGTLHLDAEYLASSTELGYATTAHRAQGITTDTSHTVANSALSRELFYVGMTRGREENHAYISHDPEHDHSPDPWNLMHETSEAVTPREQLEPVLNRSTAERTATETQASERAWSNNLGRTMHEREYLGWAARTTRTQEWVTDNYTPEKAQEIRESAGWYTLTNADPGLTHTGTPDPQDTADAILRRCDPAQAPQSTPTPTPVDRPAIAATFGQEQMLRDADARIEAELESRRASVEAHPPYWYTDLTKRIEDPQERRAAVDAALSWRAISDREHEVDALGFPPRENDRLRPYFERAAAVVIPGENWEADAKNETLRKHMDKLSQQQLASVPRRPGQPMPEPYQAPQPTRPQGPTPGI